MGVREFLCCIKEDTCEYIKYIMNFMIGKSLAHSPKIAIIKMTCFTLVPPPLWLIENSFPVKRAGLEIKTVDLGRQGGGGHARE